MTDRSIEQLRAQSAARRLRPTERREPRVRADDVDEFSQFIGVLKGRVSAAKLHAATNEDSDSES